MKKILVSKSVAGFKGGVFKFVNDLEVAADKTWAKARAVYQGNNIIYDIIVSGKKGADGKYLPIPDETIAALKKGMAIRVPYAKDTQNPTEKNNVKYENRALRFTEWEPYQLPVYEFSGKVIGDIKVTQLQGGTTVHEFRMARYMGKNQDGSYKDSMFRDVRIYGELPAIVKTGASLVVEGPYLAAPRDVEKDGKTVHYNNEYIVARQVAENKPYFLLIDEDTNQVIGTEPYEPKDEAEAPAPTEQPYEPQPAPAAPNGEAGEEDCPF